MAVEHVTHPVIGVQFHPESAASEYGYAMLDRFLHGDRSRGTTLPVRADGASEPPRGSWWRRRIDNLAYHRIHVQQQGDEELEVSHHRLDLPICRGGGRQLIEHNLQFVADAGFGQLEVAQ